MDTLPDDTLEETITLDYDDTRPYSEQTTTLEPEHRDSSLADRIGQTKVYLVTDTIAARTGKVRAIIDEVLALD